MPLKCSRYAGRQALRALRTALDDQDDPMDIETAAGSCWRSLVERGCRPATVDSAPQDTAPIETRPAIADESANAGRFPGSWVMR
jgi:hypothetical protein